MEYSPVIVDAPFNAFPFNESKSSPVTATVGTQTSSIETGGGGLESDIKLRSTVPDMQSSANDATDGDRGQRSQSAPPQSSVPSKSQQNEEPERIIPIQTDATKNYPGVHQVPRQASQAFSTQSPHFPSSQQTFQQSSQFPEEESPSSSGKKPNVRHIPIFVEGRDEPLLPRDTNQNSSKRGGCQGKPDPNKRLPEQNHHEQFPHHPQQQFHHQQQQPPYPQKHQPPNTQKQHSQHPQEQQPQQTPPPQPPQKPDPLTLVAEIVKEVDALRSKVNEWNGTSRTDKEYIYLDEMLTRNLLKLDNIETEGKEEVRNARKEAIRRIQDAINVLESKTDNKAMSCEHQVPESGGNGKEKMEVTEIDSQSEQSQSAQESSTSNATQT